MKILSSFAAAALLLLAARVNAQISLTLTPPNQFQARVTDIFSGGLMNGTGAPAQVYFTAAVKDKQSNNVLVSARTQPKDFPAGYLPFNYMMLSPAFTYNDNALQQTGMFSFGNFVLCLRAFSAATNEPLAEECIDFEVVSLSPPILLSPPDQSEIRVKHPLLTWLPPSPIDPRMGMLYDLKLVQVYANQKPYDAIVRNPAIVEAKGVKLTNLQYPAQGIPLEDNTWYAWKVVARLPEGRLIGETEVWSFIKRPETDPVDDNVLPVKNYIELKVVKDANYVAVKDEMKIVYDEKYGPVTSLLTITDTQGKVVHSEQVNFKAGENRHVINLEKIRELKKNAFYYLEVSAPDRPMQYLMFKNLK